MSTTGQVVLLTGASSGIGRAAAHRFAARGAHLHLVARQPEPLAETATECRAAGASSVVVHAVDVRAPADVDAVVADAVGHGRLDVVVVSAGVAAYGRFEETPAEVFDAVLATNVLGAANVLRAALPHLREQGDGVVVVVGSVLGDVAVPTMSAYVTSKWALKALVREISVENRDLPGVRVCLLRPGGVDTPIYQRAANVVGRPGRPPAPVQSADHVARRLVRLVDHPRPLADSGPANPLMRAGFLLVPRVYDAAVGPLFDLAALGRPGSASSTGNALGSGDGRQAVDGGHGQGVGVVLGNVVRWLHQRRPSREALRRNG